ncbi:MAG: hypothetical protein QOG63_2531 [Thermoleophilaceae bacterium]|nr:hypothetical protein [Thermoleophilaceae bacterium]
MGASAARSLCRTLALAALAALALAAPAHAGAAFALVGDATASEPDVAVDSDGNGHFAWVGNGVAKYCRVPRGGSACEVTQTLALPTNDGMVARKAFVQIPSAGRVVVLVYGCCTNTGPNRTGDYVFDSTTNGDGFLPASARRGTIDPGDVVLGPGATLSAATLGPSDTPTYQDIPLAAPAATLAEFTTPAVADLSVPVAVSGGRPAIAYGYSDQIFFRRYTGAPGGENSASGWGAEQQVGAGRNPKLAGNDNGLILGFQGAADGPLEAAKLSGSGFDPPLNVSGTTSSVTDPDLFAVPGSGPDSFFVAAWREAGAEPDELRAATSLDGGDWSTPVPIVSDDSLSSWGDRLRVAAGPDGQGFVTYLSAAGPYAASLDQVDTGSGIAPSKVLASFKGAVLQGPKACVKPGTKVKLAAKGNVKGFALKKVAFSLDAVKKTDKSSPFAKLFSTSGFTLGTKHKARAVLTFKRKKKPHKKVKRSLNATVKICP